MFFKRHLPAVFVCLLYMVGFFWMVTPIFATKLDQAIIRMDRQSANVNPGRILVQFQTSESVTETGVQLTVGQAWSNSAVVADYTVSSVGLPVGLTAVPGIGTAHSVVGKVIRFPVSNLSTGVTYGFYLTGGIASNPAIGSGPNYVWDITTLVTGAPSSSQSVGVPIGANDHIIITATVGPTISDFDAVLSTTNTGTLRPDDTVMYTITYGSSYGEASPVELQTQWGLGTLAGGTTPTVAVFEYIDGSATQAYGATDPIIDTNSRTITWSIPSLPANTQNQTVTFQLRVAAVDTGSTLVLMPVVVRVVNPVTTPDSIVTHQYQFTSVTPSPIPTSTPTVTPTPTVTLRQAQGDSSQAQDDSSPNPTAALRGHPEFIEGPTKSDTSVTFRSITISQIGHQSANLEIFLSQVKPILLNYGTSPAKLTQQLSSSSNTKRHELELTQLDASTVYYFQVQATDEAGMTVKSNIYQFTTAKSAFDLDLTKLQTSVTTGGIVLYNQADTSTQFPIVIPVNTQYEVSISYLYQTPFALAQLVLEETASQGGEDPITPTQIFLTETKPGTLNGKHTSSAMAGNQKVLLRIEDDRGNIRLIHLFTLAISTPLRIVFSEGMQPIEHARLLLYRFDPKTKTYTKVPAPSFINENPLFSLSTGVFSLALPPGTYRGDFSAHGFHSLTKEFTIGGEAGGLYPTIELSTAGWNILEASRYYYQTLTYKVAKFSELFTEVRSSRALFDVLSLASLATLTGLSYISFASRLGVSLRHIPKVMAHRLMSIKQPHLFWSLSGVAVNQKHAAVKNALISVIGSNRRVVTQVATDSRGRFMIRLNEPAMTLLVTAKNFAPLEQHVVEEELTGFTSHVITLQQITEKKWMLHTMAGLAKLALENFFEMILFLTLVMEILFIPHFGILPVLPFITLTGINLAMWLVHVYHERMPFSV